jgi:radical SAM superfamily enzyme YgiQ (UPF0313 family)
MYNHRRLLLIALDWTRPKDPPLSLGHASILANLKKHQVEVVEKSWAVNHHTFDTKDVHQFVINNLTANTDVAFGGFIWNEYPLQGILRSIRTSGFTGRIILGGPQVSYLKKEVEPHYPEVDIFIRGYAEDALAQLLRSPEKKPIIKGVHYAGEKDLGESSTVNLEQLPSPYLNGFIKAQSFIRLETQRGCPFTCSFCQHRESDSSMQRRQLEKSRIMQEIEWITRHKIIQDVAVLDPTFNSGKNYLAVLHKFFEGQFSGKLSLQSRAEMVTKEFLDAVENINQQGEVVLEFGLQTIHKNEQALVDRPTNLSKVTSVLKEVSDRNIAAEVSLIFGLPGQTLNSYIKSLQYCVDLKVPTIHAFPLMLLRGTPLYHAKAELQLMESSHEKPHNIPRVQEKIPHVISSPSFTYTEWKKMALLAEMMEEKYNPAKPDEKPGVFSEMIKQFASISPPPSLIKNYGFIK